MFERWKGVKKELYISVYPKPRAIRLSKGLMSAIDSTSIDIFIDQKKNAFGFKAGKDVKVRPDGSFSRISFMDWLGIKHKQKISVKYSTKENLFVGRIRRVSGT